MTTTRDRALEAAVELVGAHGIRALTHARVDAQAGLPRGSTSNWFRTRDALLAGLVDHVAQAESATLPRADEATPASFDHVVDMMCAGIESLTGAGAARTRTRLALMIEAAYDTDLLAPLLKARRAFVTWAADLLRGLGASDPEEAARTLLACGNGLVFHHLTIDPTAPVRPVIERTLRACLM